MRQGIFGEDDKGFCRRHGSFGTLEWVALKVWMDRGKGRGFGYVRVRRKRFRCKNQQPATSMLSAWLKKDLTANQRAGGDDRERGSISIGGHFGATKNVIFEANQNE